MHNAGSVFEADFATNLATGRDPMKVIWEMPGWDVRWSATSGQQLTPYFGQQRKFVLFLGCPLQLQDLDYARKPREPG